MFRPERPQARPFKKPNQAARSAIARHVEQISWRPLELEAKAYPSIEEKAGVVYREPPSIRPRPYGHSALTETR
jgi:hypothetical protein